MTEAGTVGSFGSVFERVTHAVRKTAHTAIHNGFTLICSLCFQGGFKRTAAHGGLCLDGDQFRLCLVDFHLLAFLAVKRGKLCAPVGVLPEDADSLRTAIIGFRNGTEMPPRASGDNRSNEQPTPAHEPPEDQENGQGFLIPASCSFALFRSDHSATPR